MKTYQAWEDGPEMPITDYIQPGDEVDDEMYNHFSGVVSPKYCTGGVLQVGEADFEHKGRRYYKTFSIVDGRHRYLGILPPFKQPK